MAKIKCNQCGKLVNAELVRDLCACECGCDMAIPNLERAENALALGDFDIAKTIYSSALALDKECLSARLGVLLCESGARNIYELVGEAPWNEDGKDEGLSETQLLLAKHSQLGKKEEILEGASRALNKRSFEIALKLYTMVKDVFPNDEGASLGVFLAKKRITNINEASSGKKIVIVGSILGAILALVIAFVVVQLIKKTPSPEDDSSQTVLESESQSQTESESSSEQEISTFVAPLSGKIDFAFSDNILVFSPTMKDYRTHLGVDILAESGTPVLAVADGIVKNVWDDPFMGRCISIEHSGGAVSIYKALDPQRADVIIGAEVSAGTMIGYSGNSAMNEIAQEPHLHFELKINGAHVDPTDYIEFDK